MGRKKRIRWRNYDACEAVTVINDRFIRVVYTGECWAYYLFAGPVMDMSSARHPLLAKTLREAKHETLYRILNSFELEIDRLKQQARPYKTILAEK